MVAVARDGKTNRARTLWRCYLCSANRCRSDVSVQFRVIASAIRKNFHGFKAVREFHDSGTCQEGDEVPVQCDP